MTRFLAILAALTCAASAQTYRTVTADTNNVIRTNFSLGRAQVSDLDGASFAISNITGLQSALDGKLATNGDGSGLTNLPNANLNNATGILPIANGGTGQTNAEAAIESLLPAYTNNADKILALNSNATGLIWTTNAGGGGGSGITTNITVLTTFTNPDFATYSDKASFDSAIGTNNTFFEDNLTNAPTGLIESELVRTNTNNALTYTIWSDVFYLFGVATNSGVWIKEGSDEAFNIFLSTTNTNVSSVGVYIFATSAGNVVRTNATFNVSVNNGAYTSSIVTTGTNSFFGIVATTNITNITFTASAITNFSTIRGVTVSTTQPVPSGTNNTTLTISNGSIAALTNQ